MSKSTTKPSWTGTRKKSKDYPKGYYKGMDSDPFNTQKDVDEFEKAYENEKKKIERAKKP